MSAPRKFRLIRADGSENMECQAEPVRPVARAGCFATEALREWWGAVDQRPELARACY